MHGRITTVSSNNIRYNGLRTRNRYLLGVQLLWLCFFALQICQVLSQSPPGSCAGNVLSSNNVQLVGYSQAFLEATVGATAYTGQNICLEVGVISNPLQNWTVVLTIDSYQKILTCPAVDRILDPYFILNNDPNWDDTTFSAHCPSGVTSWGRFCKKKPGQSGSDLGGAFGVTQEGWSCNNTNYCTLCARTREHVTAVGCPIGSWYMTPADKLDVIQYAPYWAYKCADEWTTSIWGHYSVWANGFSTFLYNTSSVQLFQGNPFPIIAPSTFAAGVNVDIGPEDELPDPEVYDWFFSVSNNGSNLDFNWIPNSYVGYETHDVTKTMSVRKSSPTLNPTFDYTQLLYRLKGSFQFNRARGANKITRNLNLPTIQAFNGSRYQATNLFGGSTINYNSVTNEFQIVVPASGFMENTFYFQVIGTPGVQAYQLLNDCGLPALSSSACGARGTEIEDVICNVTVSCPTPGSALVSVNSSVVRSFTCGPAIQVITFNLDSSAFTTGNLANICITGATKQACATVTSQVILGDDPEDGDNEPEEQSNENEKGSGTTGGLIAWVTISVGSTILVILIVCAVLYCVLNKSCKDWKSKYSRRQKLRMMRKEKEDQDLLEEYNKMSQISESTKESPQITKTYGNY